MALKRNKKNKRPLSNSDFEYDSDNIDSYTSNLPHLMVIESTEEKSITSLSPFVIEKSLSTTLMPTVKNLKNGKLLTEINNKKQANIFLNMKEFYSIKIKVYPHRILNTLKGVVKRSKLLHYR